MNITIAFLLVLHSAGVGRTGTYIALDALYQEGKKTGKVNVAEFVRKMRDNRMTMVQTYVRVFLFLSFLSIYLFVLIILFTMDINSYGIKMWGFFLFLSIFIYLFIWSQLFLNHKFIDPQQIKLIPRKFIIISDSRLFTWNKQCLF